MSRFSSQIYLPDEAATLALGARLAPLLSAGDCLALRGELGAGKTALARGIVTALTGEAEVPSPTYTLVQVYEAEACELWHGDMYRLERPQDCRELGLEDAFLDAICLIEWPDKLGEFLPQSAINITIEFDGEGRVAKIDGPYEWIKGLKT